MKGKSKRLSTIAKEARYAAINTIYAKMTDADRRKFTNWQKQNVKSSHKVSAFDWPGLRPYLIALAEELREQDAA
jgi:hypothetical protein